jgi:MFS family permease
MHLHGRDTVGNDDSAMMASLRLLIAAQFVSALADNALLLVTIAWMTALGYPAWCVPLLKWLFVAAYVVLAPWVGLWADSIPKPRLMAWMNMLKMIGAGSMLVGLSPVLAYAIVGLGAAAYAPAKYGLIAEIVPAKDLIKVNAWVEACVVCAALFGFVLGGLLVSSHTLDSLWAHRLVDRLSVGNPLLGNLEVSLLLLLLVYIIAGLLNIGVRSSGLVYPSRSVHPSIALAAFWQDNLRLWRDSQGGLSMAVTTTFWGVAACLQFLVLKWAQDILGLSLSQAAYLQAVVAVGVIAGAFAASRWVTLERAASSVRIGLFLGGLMPAIALCDSIDWAAFLLLVAGALGGWLVVPLNALLQQRGIALMSPGRSVAAQGFNENISVLLALALYSFFLGLDISASELLCGLGGFVAALLFIVLRVYRPSPKAHRCDSRKGVGS